MVSRMSMVPPVVLPMLLLGLSGAGCVKQVPKVAIAATDASPPKLVWEVYNLQSKERREIQQVTPSRPTETDQIQPKSTVPSTQP